MRSDGSIGVADRKRLLGEYLADRPHAKLNPESRTGPKTDGLQDELRALLLTHGIEYDELSPGLKPSAALSGGSTISPPSFPGACATRLHSVAAMRQWKILEPLAPRAATSVS